jgi:hypothetical protein
LVEIFEKKEIKTHFYLKVAQLLLGFDLSETNLKFSFPIPHRQFIVDRLENLPNYQDPVITLIIRETNDPPTVIEADCLCQTKIFDIYLLHSGEMIYIVPNQGSKRILKVNRDYKSGEIFGDFSNLDDDPYYPLQYVDIVFFSNWLANFGDLILHASGIAYRGRGYCFAGDSGVGKSTIIDALAQHEGVTVLGEDQVILRNMNGEFKIFGTPWHETPERCSPMGVPLEKLFFLKKEMKNQVQDVDRFDGVTRLMRTAFIPYYRPEVTSKIMDTLALLAQKVPFQELSYQLGSDVLSMVTR